MSTSNGTKIAIATVFPFPHLGGVNSHIRLLARELGVPESEVVNFDNLLPVNKSLLPTASWVLRRRFRQFFKLPLETLYTKRLVPLIAARAQDSDIVHCHDPFAGLAAQRARQKYGRRFKVVITQHGPYSRHMREYGGASERYLRRMDACEREAWAGADAIIGVDTTQAQLAIDQGAPREKVSVIPNAVDVEEIERYAAQLPLSRRDERPWVVVPRRFEPKNGVGYAIEALAHTSPRPRLILAGAGSREAEYRKLARDKGVEAETIFIGALDHKVLMPLMAAADAVLIPSVPYEGVVEATSIAAIEAMALGKPVVASGIGGLKELIRHEENGLLVEPGDPKSIAAALGRVFESAELRGRLGRAARATVEREFSAAPWMARHRAVYDRVLNGR